MPSTSDLLDEHGADAAVCLIQFRSFGARSFSGPVATVRCLEDNVLVRRRATEPGDGRVLVVDGGGSMECALLGDNIASLAQEAGWAGIVLNGCVRDTVALDELGPRRQGPGFEPAAEPEGRRRRDQTCRSRSAASRSRPARRSTRTRTASSCCRDERAGRDLGNWHGGARGLARRGRGCVRRDDELGALPERRRATARRTCAGFSSRASAPRRSRRGSRARSLPAPSPPRSSPTGPCTESARSPRCSRRFSCARREPRAPT